MNQHIELGTRLKPLPHMVRLEKWEDPSLSKTQRVFAFIVDYKKKHDGNSPTIRKIGEACGVSSTSVVFYYLNQLEEEGFIKRPEPEIGVRFATSIEVIGGSWSLNG